MCTSIPPNPRMTRDLIPAPRDHRQVQQPAELSAAPGDEPGASPPKAAGMPGSAGSCQAGRGIGWLALAQRKGDAGTRQANAAGRSPPGPAESGTHRQKSQATARGSSTHSSGPGTPARGDPPQQPRVTGLQQAGPGAPGRGAVSRSHQPHQPLMQHSIGGGAPWPGLVIGAAVLPQDPAADPDHWPAGADPAGTGKRSATRPGSPGDQRPPPAPRCRGWPPQDFDVNQPDHRVYRRGIAREPRHTRVQEIGQHLRGLVHHTRNDAIRPLSPRRQRLN